MHGDVCAMLLGTGRGGLRTKLGSTHTHTGDLPGLVQARQYMHTYWGSPWLGTS